MAILKLKNAGDEATLDIVKAEVVTGEYGQQVRFDAANGDTLYVPESSVQRQLDRCKVAEIEELSGTTLHFYRAPNSKKGGAPFWNIDAAREEDVKTPASNGHPPVANGNPSPPKTVPGGEEETAAVNPKVEAEKAFLAKHKKAFQYVIAEYLPLVPEDIVVDLRGLAALTYQVLRGKDDAR